MTYLVGAELPDAPAGVRFRALLSQPGIVRLPGAHNGLAALQARDAGFPGLYLSGAAMSASMGLPDLGVITIEDVCFFIRQVARAAGLPVLVDGDTGYGEALNVMHMVRAFEDAGAAAVHLEDQLLPKKCGHLNDKRLADPRAATCSSWPAPMPRQAKGSMAPWHARSSMWKPALMRFSPKPFIRRRCSASSPCACPACPCSRT
jgi:hypothetical protein